MDFLLNGRVAFVAGASSGLGLAAATELAREGCRVAICSRDRDRIDEAANRLASQAGVGDDSVLAIACDVTDEASIRRAIDATVSRFGSLQILVTNAGGPPTGKVDDFSQSDWEQALRLNLVSTINLTRSALPHLREGARRDGFGRIVMVSSITAKQPVPALYLSNVSRAGVQGFAKSLAEELGPLGITVNTVLPGYTRTARLRHLSEALHAQSGRSIAEIEGDWASGTALKRIGREDEFAAVVAFLASDRASYVTGVSLSIDGGATKGLL